jgi:hypothetical protein
MRAKKKKPDIDEAEWNFSNRELFPDDQVSACFFYEFAREFAKGSNRWKALVGQLDKLQQLPKGDPRKAAEFDIWNEILDMFPSGPKVGFCSFQFVKTCWARIASEERGEIIAEWKDTFQGPANFQEAICLQITLQRELPEWQKCGVVTFEDWVLMDACFHSRNEQREHGFIGVNWDYTNGQLVGEFKKWLHKKRGERKSSASEQGQNKERQHLKALGAKRLLDAGFGAKSAMDYSQGFIKGKDGHPSPLFDNPRTWYVAKNQTVPRVLQHLFPSSTIEK